MTLREYILYKQFPKKVQEDLLHIAGSSHWLEDLIDYIADISDSVKEAQDELSLTKMDVNVEEEANKSLRDQIIKLKEFVGLQRAEIRRTATVGGIEVTIDR